jgi:hypothetical protein
MSPVDTFPIPFRDHALVSKLRLLRNNPFRVPQNPEPQLARSQAMSD